MKKILFILHYPPPVHGAAMVGQYIRDSEIINTAFTTKYINLGTSESVDRIGKSGWKKWKRFFTILWQSLIALVKFRPNLVYFTLTSSGIGFYKDAMIVFLVKSFGKSVVFHFHNKGVNTYQNRSFDNLLYKLVFRNSQVILLSDFLYSDVKKYVPKERVHFCANGIPDLYKSNYTDQTFKKSVELLFLSNLISSKGVLVLLEACRFLKDSNLDFHCTFIGGEADINAKIFQENVKKLGLENQVHYAGRKYGQEKELAYLHSDIFILPTFYSNECFPLVLLEAMQFGLPVISTFEGGIPSIVIDSQTGFLIKQKDIVALAEKLEVLILDKNLRKEMGSNGRRRFEQEFTVQIFEKRLTKILEGILKIQ